MYLSRVEIDINNRRKIRDLTHAGAYHNWVERSFPDEIFSKKRSRKLWRLDELHGKTYLLLTSKSRPDTAALEQYGVVGTAECKDYDSFLEKIKEGDIYRFKITLNPVHSVSENTSERGRVYPEITAEKQLQYLEKRAGKHGFMLLPNQYEITCRRYVPLKKIHQKTVRLCQVSYEGILKVTNLTAFRDALTMGIGKEKAYGCGLMTVIPISN
jgi:CRISPR system Cascade subunit CasE